MFMWILCQNRYAYSDEVDENFDDEDALPLKSKGNVELEKVSFKSEKERKVVTTDVFSLDDEVEEDKRE